MRFSVGAITIQKRYLYIPTSKEKYFLAGVSTRCSSRLQGASEVCAGNYELGIHVTGSRGSAVQPVVSPAPHSLQRRRPASREFQSLISVDALVSLFTNVPIDEALQVIQERLREDESLGDRIPLSAGRVAELLEVCLKSTISATGRFLRADTRYSHGLTGVRRSGESVHGLI